MEPLRVELTGKTGRHRYRVRLRAVPFDKKKHRVRKINEVEYSIDGEPESGGPEGKNWWGCDGGLPSLEIVEFTVRVDGRLWAFPRSLWSDCYNPGLTYTGRYPALLITLSPTGKHIRIQMSGSDGAGSYTVIWNLYADRRPTRAIGSGG
jgi:hypothetical protein